MKQRFFLSCVLLAAFILMHVSVSVHAQVPHLYTLDHGLTSSYMASLYVDSHNFAWVSTNTSLEIFDGHRFQRIDCIDPQTGRSLFNRVNLVRQIDDDHFWVLTNTGLCVYHLTKNTFRTISLGSWQDERRGVSVVDIQPYPKENYQVVMTDGYGSYVFNEKEEVVDTILTARLSRLIGGRYLRQMLIDENGLMWTNSIDHHLSLVDLVAGKEIPLQLTDEAAKILTHSYVTSFVVDEREGKVFMTMSQDGVLVYERRSGLVREAHENNRELYAMTMLLTHDGLLLFGTDNNGLWELDRKTESMHRYAMDLDNTDLSIAKVHYLTEDLDGNLLAGIYQRGLLVLPRKTGGFGFHALSLSKSGRNSASVTSFVTNQSGELWMGTDGAGVFNGKRLHENGQPTGDYEIHPLGGLPSSLVQSMVIDRNGSIWAGSWQGGITRLDPPSDTFVTPAFLRLYNWWSVMCLTYDESNHVLYAGTNGNGLYRIDLKTEQVEQLCPQNYIFWVNHLYLDRDGLLWIDDPVDCFCYDTRTKKLTNVKMLDEEIVTTNDCTQDGNQVLFGTDHGLFCYDKIEKKFVTPPYVEKLPKDLNIKSLRLYGNYIWMSTGNAVLAVDKRDNRVIQFHSFDGFYLGEFHKSSSILLPDGTILFGADNGVLSFNASSILNLPQDVRPVYFTPLWMGNRIEGRESFSVTFSVPELAVPDRINYTYILEGYEREWHTTTARDAHAYYASLPSGSYTLRVRAYYEDDPGRYSERTLSVNVPYPWYATWWAYLLYLLILSAIAYIIYMNARARQRARHLLRKARQKELLQESKLQLFTSIAHELRSPVTMILSENEKLHNNILQRNCERLLRVVNQITDIRKIDSGQFELKFQEVEFLSYATPIMESFKGISSAKNINYTSESTNSRIDVWIDPEHFEKILANLISNAFKFTPASGSILVRSSVRDNNTESGERLFDDDRITEFMELRVYNSGSHLDERDLRHLWERFYQGETEQRVHGSGIGLNLCHELVRLHHGQIRAHNVGEDGVEFVVCIPLGRAHLDPSEINPEPYEPVAYEMDALQQPNEGVQTDEEHEEPAVEEPKQEDPVQQAEPVAVVEAAPAAQPEAEHEGGTVLVVDDDEELAAYVQSQLADTYNVLVAHGGNEAWQMILKTRPEVVVTDLMMPNGDGFELCQRIKNNPETDHIAVIVLTSESSEHTMLRTMTLQADHFLPKPFDLPLLRSALSQVLRVRENIRNKMRRTDIGHDYSSVTIDSAEDKLIKRVMDAIMKHLDDSEFGVQELSDAVGLSRVHLNRKMKEHFGISPNTFIRSVRLKQAAYLLVNNKVTISEVAYKVGFSSHSYFSSNFHEYFGMSPKEFVAYYSDDLNEEALKKLLQ